MIGIVCDRDRTAIVAEFFELFKTPWEFHTPGRQYDVLLVCGNHALPAVDAKLALVFGAAERVEDAQLGIRHAGRGQGSIDIGVARLPIYGECARFRVASAVDGDGGGGGDPASIVTVADSRLGAAVVRCGYDLFAEVEYLLASGQPVENAHVPTLDLHIDLLRRSILDAALPLVEIPPSPAGFDFTVALTHDVDFLDLKRHGLDRTALGFLYRAVVGSVRDVVAGRSSLRRLLKNWKAAAAWPLVHLGLARDPWSPFEQYVAKEGALRSTFFVIPFRDRAGDHVPVSKPSRRAVAYDVDDIRVELRELSERGFEIAVHGIDAWNSDSRAREELARISAVTGDAHPGIRMHWLLCDEGSAARLDRAGYAYDSTFGYNDAVGFRAGTAQVFRPLSASRLLELPLHVQDTALFFPRRLHLRETEAWRRCHEIWQWTEALGGVLTILWHERSLAPERQWADFYGRLLETLVRKRTWLATAREVTQWFEARRAMTIGTPVLGGGVIRVHVDLERSVQPPPAVRIHVPRAGAPPRRVDVPCVEARTVEVDIDSARVT